MSATLINIQHGETGRLKEWPVTQPIPHGWARVSEPFETDMTPPQPSEEASPRDISFSDQPIRLKCKAGQVITTDLETLCVDPAAEVEVLKAERDAFRTLANDLDKSGNIVWQQLRDEREALKARVAELEQALARTLIQLRVAYAAAYCGPQIWDATTREEHRLAACAADVEARQALQQGEAI